MMKTAAFEQTGFQLDLEVQCVGLFEGKLLASCGVSNVADDHDSSKGWAGLLWSPKEVSRNMVTRETLFPQTLLQGLLVGYRGADREIPAGGFVAVEQLISIREAINAPEASFLRWITRYSNSALFSVKPPADLSGGAFTDELWQYGVSEFFVAQTDTEGRYLEFEMTPEGDWVALRFVAPRKRARGYAILSEEPWVEHIRMLKGEGFFGMELSFKLLQPFLNGQSIALQCCVSSGRGEYGLLPWWEVSESPADFHQPDRFYKITLL